MRYQISATLLILFIAFTGFECKKNPVSAGTIQVSSYAPQLPVLKGVETNPLLRIALFIPEGSAEVTVDHIEAQLNAEAVPLLSQLDVFLTGAEHFAATNKIGTLTPASPNVSLPVKLKLKPGMHFIWVSTQLKSDAVPGTKITFHCTALSNNAGSRLPIKETGTGYTKYTGVAIRKAGEDAVNTYRIPGIAVTNKGTLISVYDIRYNNSADLPGNIDVGMSRSTNGGSSWEPMKVIMDMGAPHENNGVGDPAILVDPSNGRIWVAALWSKGNRSIAGSLPGISPDTTGQFVVVSSDDDGRTWSAPQTLTPQIKNPAWHLFFNGPGAGIAMQNGNLVFPAQYWDENRKPWSTIIYSEDHGKNWIGKLNGPKINTTESQVIETTPGVLMLNMRDNRGGFRSVATTSNLGKSWTEHATSFNTLPDPVCMGSILKASVRSKEQLREVVFFSNANTSSGRFNITIKASMDLGESWPAEKQLLIDERNCYGYSCLVRINESTIGLLYEGTRDLYFVPVPVSDIIK